MQTELYKAIKALKIENLNTDDKKELLKIFMVTQNSLIRNHIALIFSDIKFNEAVPYIIKKINEKNLFNNNGSLIFSLRNLDSKKYFNTFVKIICQQEYEARLTAFGIIEKYANSISNSTKQSALKILEECQMKQGQIDDDEYEDSTLHFIEATIKLLK